MSIEFSIIKNIYWKKLFFNIQKSTPTLWDRMDLVGF